MKLQMIIAAVLCAVVVALGFIPSDTPVQADSIAIADDNTLLSDFSVVFNETEQPTLAEPELAEVDTSLPPEEPTPSEPEAPNAAADSKSSCPATSKSAASGHARGRDFKLFDGDGFLIDARANASARGDGGGLFPRLKARRQAAAAGECVPLQPIRNFFRRRN